MTDCAYCGLPIGEFPSMPFGKAIYHRDSRICLLAQSAAILDLQARMRELEDIAGGTATRRATRDGPRARIAHGHRGS